MMLEGEEMISNAELGEFFSFLLARSLFQIILNASYCEWYIDCRSYKINLTHFFVS